MLVTLSLTIGVQYIGLIRDKYGLCKIFTVTKSRETSHMSRNIEIELRSL